MIITGLLTLTQRLLCRNEALGKEFIRNSASKERLS